MISPAEKDHAVSAEKTALERRVLLVTILASALVFLDSSVVGVALPSIQRELGITTYQQQWVVSAYLLTLSTLLLVGGRLADIFGRVRMLRTGMAGYTVLALVAALSPGAGALIGARALQGVAGAMLVPTTLAIISATFDEDRRGKAIGTWAAWSGIATVLGPVLGGFVIDNVSWRWAMLITPAFATATLLLSRRLPESKDDSGDNRLDFVGVALLVASLGSIVTSLIQGQVLGWTSVRVVGPALVGIVLMPVFIWWEGRARSPVMPYGMFSNHNLAVANVVTFFVYAGLYGMLFYVPLYLQTALRTSATLAASIMIPVTVLLFFISPFAGRLNDRYGPRWLMCFGPWTAAVGIVVMGMTGPGQVWTVLMPGMVLFGIGLGFTVTPVTATAIGSAERRYSGVASGFNNAVSRIAGLVAIALMGVIVIQLWQAGVEATVSGASGEVATAMASVRDKAFLTPTGESLGSADANEVERVATDASRVAFRNGMLLAAILVAAGGFVSAIWIRPPERVRAGEPGTAPR